MSEFNEVTYDVLLRSLAAGELGTSIEMWMKRHEDGATNGDYTVYWPKDSIRVIVGADYATARTIMCILRDERTRWMGEPTTGAEPVLARARRPLGANWEWATFNQVATPTVYVKDRLLPADIRVEDVDFYSFEQAQFPGAPYRFDYSTLPES